MKTKFIIQLGIISIVTASIIACTKSAATAANNYTQKDSLYIYVDSCTSKIFNNVQYNICVDSVWDSRCPLGSVCVWEGVGVVRLKCTYNGVLHTLKLGTNNITSIKNDTTIAGVNFRLDSLTPHPATTIIYPYSAYKAKIVMAQ